MKVIKKQSDKTYVNEKTKKECHYYNYYLVLDNGKRVQIRCAFPKDNALLEAVCTYEK